MGEPSVRDAEQGDAEAYARVRHASWQVAYRDLFPADRLAAIDVDEWVAQTREGFAEPVTDGFHRLVSVDADDQVVAMAFCGRASDPFDDVTGQLYAIYAHPEKWGRGHGHALIEEVHRRLADDGHERALLWVAAGNDRTIAWYESHGWRLDGTTQSEEVHGITAEELRMVRTLRRGAPVSR